MLNAFLKGDPYRTEERGSTGESFREATGKGNEEPFF
jgi:hypothetical protein